MIVSTLNIEALCSSTHKKPHLPQSGANVQHDKPEVPLDMRLNVSRESS